MSGHLGLGIAATCYCVEGPLCCIGDHESPLTIPALEFPETVLEISVGFRATLARMDGGLLRCWGCWGGRDLLPSHAVGLPGVVLGDDELASDGPPVDVGGTVEQVVTHAHTCALLTGGAVRCWGDSEMGALGSGNIESIGDDEVPAAVPPVALPGPAAEIAIGRDHSCARLVDGTVWCWGSNEDGQIGHPGIDRLGDDEPIDTVGPVDVGGFAVALASGGYHNCVLLDTGAMRCWGDNEGGQLGYGHTNNIGDDETPASAGDVPLQ